MPHFLTGTKIATTGSYDGEFFTNFTILLNIQMARVKSLPSNKIRSVFSSDRVSEDMKMDLIRANYFVNGRKVSVRNEVEASIDRLGKELQKNHCVWAIEHMEELSAILNQGIVKTIYDAKQLCLNNKRYQWYPGLDFKLDTLNSGGSATVYFCIYPENKLYFGISSNVGSMTMCGGDVLLTDSQSSRFETVIFVSFASTSAHDGTSRLVALPVITGNIGYTMELHIGEMMG